MAFELNIRFDHALKGYNTHLNLNDEQCQEIANDFGMVALHSLSAAISTKALKGDKPIVKVAIELSMDVSQECGVSLQIFRHELTHNFALDCIEKQNVTNEVIEIGSKELELNDLDEPDVISDGRIDLGQYLIEALSEVYDPYARAPGAIFVEPETAKEPSPFAVLSQLKPKGHES